MSRKGHQPVRTCMGCGERTERADLMRIIRGPNGVLALDAEGSAPGRGGYLHRGETCWKKFSRRKGIVRSFRAPVRSQARTALLEELGAVAAR